MGNKGKYYITTAIAYASGKPHIGNTYEIILADAIARWKRQEGYEVQFQTGTDEHGQKIEDRANAAGMSPKEFVDRTAGEIRRIWDLMNTSYDFFIRTTDDFHEKQIQKIFRKMYEKGDIYLGEYKGMYCKECEAFYTESQLINGKCPLDGCDVEPASEPAYFFKMSKYADRLIDYINTHPEFIQPESRKNEMMNNFLLPGLTDLCVSRTSFSWGVPIDFAPGHVSYVWLDALANYITGIGYDADGHSTITDAPVAFWQKVVLPDGIRSEVNPLTGEIEIAKATKEQLPPAYSAKKIDGVKAYELARKGEMPDLKPSPVTIYSLDITDIMKRDKGLAIDFDCMCSKGTYIRTICSDLGDITGFGAYAESLRRTVNGQFNVKDAYTPDELEKMAEAGDFSFVRDASETISFLPEIKLDPKQTKDIKFGRKIAFPIDVKPEGGERIYYRATNEDKLIAVVFPQEENGDLVMRIERLYAHD